MKIQAINAFKNAVNSFLYFLYGKPPSESENEKRFIELEIERTKSEIERTYKMFSTVDEPELVDEAVYRLKSLEAKYGYLLKRYKGEEK